MTQEIKPCPFCDTQGKMGDDRVIYSPEGLLHCYMIYCPNIKCPIQPRTKGVSAFKPDKPNKKGENFTTEELAKKIIIDVWNTRKG